MTITTKYAVYNVTPITGAYLVTAVKPQGVKTHTVKKDKTCSCGGSARRQCRHIRAVKAHLKRGGDRAPVQPKREERSPQAVWESTRRRFQPDPDFSERASEHRKAYWQRVRVSPQERQTFLAGARARYNEYLRAAYGSAR